MSRAARHRASWSVSHRVAVAALAALAVVAGSLALRPGADAAGDDAGEAPAPAVQRLSSEDVHADDHAGDDHEHGQDGLRTVPSLQREISIVSGQIRAAKRALRRCDDRASRRAERACERRHAQRVRSLKAKRAGLRDELRRSRRPAAGTPTAAGGGYSLLWTSYPDARWRCTSTLTFRVNTANAPANAVADTKAAFALVGQANGYSYSYLGGTTATGPSSEADIIVSWTPGQVDNGGGAIAVGGASMSWRGNGKKTIGSGYVTVESSFRATPGLGTEGRAGTTLGRVLVHEIGHVMGLGHVDDSRQIMFGTIGYQTTAMNTGDRAGFVRQGKVAACA